MLLISFDILEVAVSGCILLLCVSVVDDDPLVVKLVVVAVSMLLPVNLLIIVINAMVVWLFSLYPNAQGPCTCNLVPSIFSSLVKREVYQYIVSTPISHNFTDDD